MTLFSEIYNLALSQIDDPLLAQWTDADLKAQLHEWMIQAIYKLPKLRSELSDKDETNERFNSDLSDTTKMALAMMMVKEWLSPQIKSVTLTLQRSSKKESYSQSEHLKGLMALDNSIDVDVKKLLRDNSYVDSEYFE